MADKKEYEETLYSTIAVPVAKLMPDGEEVMCMEISEGLVKGVMIESYNEEGNQKICDHVYGKSITDPCLGWEDTEKLLYEIADNC